MDAANSLLNILNTSVDPVTGLRYMPLKYYLYVIYAAVFLFKVCLPPSATPLILITDNLARPASQAPLAQKHPTPSAAPSP